MAFFIKLDSGDKVDLPQEYDVHERVKFCDEIIDKYVDNFAVGLRNRSYRLEVMANYILDAADKDKEYPTITSYKEVRNKVRERKFSELEQKYDKNKQNY